MNISTLGIKEITNQILSFSTSSNMGIGVKKASHIVRRRDIGHMRVYWGINQLESRGTIDDTCWKQKYYQAKGPVS